MTASGYQIRDWVEWTTSKLTEGVRVFFLVGFVNPQHMVIRDSEQRVWCLQDAHCSISKNGASVDFPPNRCCE
jgi:hypothetical protein